MIALSLRFKKIDPNETLREELAEHSIARQMKRCILGVGNVIRARPRKDGSPTTTSAAALPFSHPDWPADNEVETWKTFLRDLSLRSDALVASLRGAGDSPPVLGNIVAANEELRALAQRLPVN